MNKLAYLTIVTVVILVTAALSGGCRFLKPGAASSPAVSSEPLTSSWKMSRMSIEPPLPTIIPGLVVDQIIPKSPTWAITLSDNQLKPSFDGRATWFNSLGLPVSVRTPSITESADKKSVTLSGGGTIQAEKLPGPLALIGGVSDLSIDYTDKIEVTLTSQDQISAIITYSASGKYTGNKGPDSFNNSATVKYTGKRK